MRRTLTTVAALLIAALLIPATAQARLAAAA
jgi:hypothetical protein